MAAESSVVKLFLDYNLFYPHFSVSKEIWVVYIFQFWINMLWGSSLKIKQKIITQNIRLRLNIKPISKFLVRLGKEESVLLKCDEALSEKRILLGKTIVFLVFNLQRRSSCGQCSSRPRSDWLWSCLSRL